MGYTAGTNLVALEKGINTEFLKWRETYADLNPLLRPLVQIVNSKAAFETYGWLSQHPAMRKDIGDRVFNAMLDHKMVLANEDWVLSEAFKQSEWEDDQYGMIKTRVSQMTERTETNDVDLFIERVTLGATTGLAYDGLPFFSASHQEHESPVQSNIHTGTGVTATAFANDLYSVKSKMARLVGDRGIRLNSGLSTNLVVLAPPELSQVVDTALKADMISNTSNIVKGAAQAIYLPFADTNDWYVFDVGGVVKPILKQVRMNPVLDLLAGGEIQKSTGRIEAHLRYRMTFGYGLWFKAFKVTNS